MLVLVGVNHKSAPLAFRERLAFPDAEIGASLARLISDRGFDEGMILSTCNRVEVLAFAPEGRGGAGASAVKRFLASERGVAMEEIDRYSYHHAGKEAVRHLFHVASGLDSMILGEPQILGQVRRAFAAAQAAGSTGSVLEHLLQRGLHVAKRVRTETGISRLAVSIAFAAVSLAKKIFDDLQGKSVLLLGAGKMTELAARHLVSSGATDVIVSSRTYNRAARLAERVGGRIVNWDDAFAVLQRVDIVVSGTAAPQPIVTRSVVRDAIRGRRRRPLFLIDMAVPRDIEPSVNDLDGVYLYDIDDLQGVVDSNLEERGRAAETARRMIEHEVAAFERWINSLGITPTIRALRETLLEMGRREVARFRGRLGPLSPEQERAIEELARSLVQKVLHRPITHLKTSADRGDAGRSTALYREIFGLPDAPAEESEASGRLPAEDGAPEPPGPRRLLPGGRED